MAVAAAIMATYGADGGAASQPATSITDVPEADSARTACLKQMLVAMTGRPRATGSGAVAALDLALSSG